MLQSSIRILVVEATGSAPREAGAAMRVWADGFNGSIGGGALEHAAIAVAHEWLAQPELPPWHRDLKSYPLGPALGQCCGGLVRLLYEVMPNQEFDSSSALLRADGSVVPLNIEAAAENAPLAHQSRPRIDPSAEPLAGWPSDLPVEKAISRATALNDPSDQCTVLAPPTFEPFGPRHHGRAPGLIVRPITSGVAPVIVLERMFAADWPLPVLRVVKAMLSGARPRQTVLVAGGARQPHYIIEPQPRPPHTLYLYGAGHVGRAVVRALEDLPFAIVWIDVAADRFPVAITSNATTLVTADPTAIAAAPPHALHLVMTFSHPLDLALTATILARPFAWAGLIGSASKRTRFEKRLREGGIAETALRRLNCPIGIGGITGKEPAMIAVSVAAQLAAWASSDISTWATTANESSGP